jgi:hypothetical protein
METINRPNGPWDLNADAGAALVERFRREAIENPRIPFRAVRATADDRIDEINARITARLFARRAA